MREEDLKQRLRERNLRITPNRLDLLNSIARFSGAIPHARLQADLKSMDRVTLYRTLNSLLEKGLIHRASAKEQESHYALCEDSCKPEGHQHQHIHFKCDNCEKIFCLPLQQDLELNTGSFKVNTFEVLATGVCETCS
jgi:Fur family ferric uptake transcriptional regulator